MHYTYPKIKQPAKVGASLCPKCPAMTANARYETTVELTAEKLGELMAANVLAANTTYVVTDDSKEALCVQIEKGCGNGAVIVLPTGVIFDGVCEYKDLTIYADFVGITGSKGARFANIQVNGAYDALYIENTCSEIDLVDCRLTAKGVALENESASLNVSNSYFAAPIALSDESAGDGLYVNNVFAGNVSLMAADTTLRDVTVEGDLVCADSTNLLVATSGVTGNVTFVGTHNCVLLLSELSSLRVKDATSTFVCANTVSGQAAFENLCHLLVNNNNLSCAPMLSGVTDYNGDNVTDVNERAECGVNEKLLPHPDLDAHINMARKSTVRTLDRSNPTISEYINALKSGETIIIPPAAYAAKTHVNIVGVEDASILAYGVYFERDFYDHTDGNWSETFVFHSAKRIDVRGLMVGNLTNSSSHLIVLAKPEVGKILCTPAAGMRKYWSNNLVMAYHQGEALQYADMHPYGYTYDEATNLGTFGLSPEVWQNVRPGDIFTGRNGYSVFLESHTDKIFFEDVTILGGALRCFYDHRAEEGTLLHRVKDVPAPAKIIDKETYDLYRGYEDTYGMSTGVYVDKFGNYRGTPAKTGTADFAHSTGSRTGMKATSCHFSSLSDDGCNICGINMRLASFDPETGALVSKRNHAALGYVSSLRPFLKGDRVQVYALTGRLLCDTVALSDSVEDTEKEQNTVYIDPKAMDVKALAEYELDNDRATYIKVLVDNLSANGNAFLYDNTLLENTRSRGSLIKDSDVEICYCTYRNIGMGAVALVFEPEWNESGPCENVYIHHNCFENTGYYSNINFYSPINVQALDTRLSDDFLTFHDIRIENNVIRDRGTSHAVFASGVENITIKGNDFGDCADGHKAASVYAMFVKGMEVSDNVYSARHNLSREERVLVTDSLNVFGTDIGESQSDERAEKQVKVTAYAENTPTGITPDSMDGLVFHGDWEAGFMPVDNFSFTPFNRHEGNWNWVSYGKGVWSETGGVSTNARDNRFVATHQNCVAYRHTVDRDATFGVTLGRFLPPTHTPIRDADSDGSADGLFAIFCGDRMVWPTAGGSYTKEEDWYTITTATNQSDINMSLKSLRFDGKKGEAIYFICRKKRDGFWSYYSALPHIYYL